MKFYKYIKQKNEEKILTASELLGELKEVYNGAEGVLIQILNGHDYKQVKNKEGDLVSYSIRPQKMPTVQEMQEELSKKYHTEPLFIIRAKDRLSVPAIECYKALASVVKVPTNFKQTLNDVILSFNEWQTDNRAKVQTPD